LGKKDKAASLQARFKNQPLRWFIIPQERIVEAMLEAESSDDAVSRDLARIAVDTIISWNKKSAGRFLPCANCHAAFDGQRRPAVYMVGVMFPGTKDRTALAQAICSECADRCDGADAARELTLRLVREVFPNYRLESPGTH
jgi:hypothetical protein